MQGMCLGVTNPITAVSQARTAVCPSRHPCHPQAAVYGFRRQPELPLAAPSLQGLPGLWVGSWSSLLPQGSSLALSLHGQKSLFCHRKKNPPYLSPDQLLHVPTSLFMGTES